MTEDQLEQEALGWLADVGYARLHGPDIAHDGRAPERASYREVLLVQRLRHAVAGLNPGVPAAAREDAVKQVLDLGTPVLLAANRQFHRLLVNGVPVQYQIDGETRGDFVRLVDWADHTRNDWLAVNQFAITGPHHTRRPEQQRDFVQREVVQESAGGRHGRNCSGGGQITKLRGEGASSSPAG